MPLACMDCVVEVDIGETTPDPYSGKYTAPVECPECGREGEVLVDPRTWYMTTPTPGFVWDDGGALEVPG